MNVTKRLLPMLLLWAGATASAQMADTGRSLVDAFVNDVATLSSRFEQTLLDADGSVLDRSAGTLEIQRPGRFRWAIEDPYEQWLIADGLNVWSYDVDLAQVVVKPQSEALASTPALLLGGSAEVFSEFNYDGSFEESGLTWVRMIPVNTESGFRQVDLAFAGDSLRQMVFVDNLQQTTFVILTDVSVNETIDAARFVFEVPEDVDVVGTPITEPASADPASAEDDPDAAHVMSEAVDAEEGDVTPADDQLVHTLPLTDIAD